MSFLTKLIVKETVFFAQSIKFKKYFTIGHAYTIV